MSATPTQFIAPVAAAAAPATSGTPPRAPTTSSLPTPSSTPAHALTNNQKGKQPVPAPAAAAATPVTRPDVQATSSPSPSPSPSFTIPGIYKRQPRPTRRIAPFEEIVANPGLSGPEYVALRRKQSQPYWERSPEELEPVLLRAVNKLMKLSQADPANEPLELVYKYFERAFSHLFNYLGDPDGEYMSMSIVEVVHAHRCAEKWEKHERAEEVGGQMGSVLAYLSELTPDDRPVEFLLRAGAAHIKQLTRRELGPLKAAQEEEGKQLFAAGYDEDTPEWKLREEEWDAQWLEEMEKLAPGVLRTREMLHRFADVYGSEIVVPTKLGKEKRRRKEIKKLEVLNAARDRAQEAATSIANRKRARNEDDDADADADQDRASGSKRARTIAPESSASAGTGVTPRRPDEMDEADMDDAEAGPLEKSARAQALTSNHDATSILAARKHARSDEEHTEFGPRRKKARTCYALSGPMRWLGRMIFGRFRSARVRRTRMKHPELPTRVGRTRVNPEVGSSNIHFNDYAFAPAGPTSSNRPLYHDLLNDYDPVRHLPEFGPHSQWWGNENKLVWELDPHGEVLEKIVKEKVNVLAAKKEAERAAARTTFQRMLLSLLSSKSKSATTPAPRTNDAESSAERPTSRPSTFSLTTPRTTATSSTPTLPIRARVVHELPSGSEEISTPSPSPRQTAALALPGAHMSYSLPQSSQANDSGSRHPTPAANGSVGPISRTISQYGPAYEFAIGKEREVSIDDEEGAEVEMQPQEEEVIGYGYEGEEVAEESGMHESGDESLNRDHEVGQGEQGFDDEHDADDGATTYDGSDSETDFIIRAVRGRAQTPRPSRTRQSQDEPLFDTSVLDSDDEHAMRDENYQDERVLDNDERVHQAEEPHVHYELIDGNRWPILPPESHPDPRFSQTLNPERLAAYRKKASAKYHPMTGADGEEYVGDPPTLRHPSNPDLRHVSREEIRFFQDWTNGQAQLEELQDTTSATGAAHTPPSVTAQSIHRERSIPHNQLADGHAEVLPSEATGTWKGPGEGSGASWRGRLRQRTPQK